MSEQFGLIKNEGIIVMVIYSKGSQPVADDAHIRDTTHQIPFQC